ncbi:hypothetical protein DID80_01670 [Candidatus Marinamargulisbacteria bacterium SCGC AAA071-K20]|nr:hypothetical protein DID80_01670 [Candidatus Marinamargulisbacteria bacterium SCGC AAA071-K20]
MSKTKLKPEEIEDQLNKQLNLLSHYVSEYQKVPELALALATTIRVLCHDTKNQKSLLSQLKFKTSTHFKNTPFLESSDNKAPFCGLVYIRLNFDRAWFEPKFNETTQSTESSSLHFDDWWNTVIIRDYEGRYLSRKDLVLEMADRDGGAHVDKALGEDYYCISRKHSLTWTFHKDNNKPVPVTGIEQASVVQIGHELLCTLKDAYHAPELSKEAMLGEFSAIGQPGKEMFGKALPFRMEQSRKGPSGTERNLPCYCGSGKKSKKCCPNGTTVYVTTKPIG